MDVEIDRGVGIKWSEGLDREVNEMTKRINDVVTRQGSPTTGT